MEEKSGFLLVSVSVASDCEDNGDIDRRFNFAEWGSDQTKILTTGEQG